ILCAAARDSFHEASTDLKALAGLSVSPSHVRRLSVRFGTHWADLRDADVRAFKDNRLRVAHQTVAQAAVVMLDGGRLLTRSEAEGPGVAEPGWREFKAANLETLQSELRTEDPQPQPPARFRDQEQVARLAAELKAARGGGGKGADAARK